jgi:transposase
VPFRKVPAILKELTGITVTQSALTQDALKQSEGPVGQAYEQLRAKIKDAPFVHTDDTGWRTAGRPAQLMVFETDEETVFQIRPQHRNEEVREVIPSDYAGVMVTDRGRVTMPKN